MGDQIRPEDWKSTEMIRAENDLFDEADRVEAELAEVDERMSELEDADKPASAAEIEALRTWATGPNAPAEWRAVIERINAGQLTWQAIANGQATSDPAVMTALDATIRMSVEIPEDGAGEVMPTRPPARRRPAQPEFDEEDFSSNTIMRKW